MKNSNNNIILKKNNVKKTIKINPKYFFIELIPYNKILNNIMKFLQKKLSSKLFNEIYQLFIKEIKKYVNITSYKNLKIKDNNINKRINLIKNSLIAKNKPIITEFCINNFDMGQKNKFLNIKTNLTKKTKPLVGLCYAHKLNFPNSKKTLSNSSFSNININNLNNLDINFIKDYSINYKKSINPKTLGLDKTISYSNSNSKERDKLSNIENKNKNKNKKKIYLNNIKYITNDKILNNKKNLYNSYNTINTSIHKNIINKSKKINFSNKNKKEHNSQHISNNIRKKISNNKTLTNIPHQTFKGLSIKNNQINKIKSTTNNNIKNAIVVNNSIFHKYKNNYNFGILDNNKKKLKIINIKLQKPKNNGGRELLKPLQNSEEMLKKIRNSLDDDNLKGMLNFSYENFLSKESERDSKEYSVED